MAKKILNITFLDGTPEGDLECRLKPGDVVMYKISRDKLKDYKSLPN